MLLPTILVWNTKFGWSKKLALVGLFSLSIVTIIIALIRAVMVDSTRRPDGNPNVTWLWFWSAVEPSVGMFCLLTHSLFSCVPYWPITLHKHT